LSFGWFSRWNVSFQTLLVWSFSEHTWHFVFYTRQFQDYKEEKKEGCKGILIFIVLDLSRFEIWWNRSTDSNYCNLILIDSLIYWKGRRFVIIFIEHSLGSEETFIVILIHHFYMY
jgi:hypothetical protein